MGSGFAEGRNSSNRGKEGLATEPPTGPTRAGGSNPPELSSVPGLSRVALAFLLQRSNSLARHLTWPI